MLKFARWASVICAVLFLCAMLLPLGGLEAQSGIPDSYAHALAFAFITGALFLNAPRAPRLVVMLCAVGIGGGVEIIQHFVGRDAELRDLAADIVGIAITGAIWPRRGWVRAQAISSPSPNVTLSPAEDARCTTAQRRSPSGPHLP